MEARDFGKIVAGAAVYKLQDHYLPTYFTYPMYNVDLAKVGLGVAEIALAYFGERKFEGAAKDFVDALAIAGITQIVSEVAGAVGVSSPEIYVNSKYYAPEALPPAPYNLVKVD